MASGLGRQVTEVTNSKISRRPGMDSNYTLEMSTGQVAGVPAWNRLAATIPLEQLFAACPLGVSRIADLEPSSLLWIRDVRRVFVFGNDAFPIPTASLPEKLNPKTINVIHLA
jgi:hypothetical protein